MKKIISIIVVLLLAAVIYGLNYIGVFKDEENIRQATNLPQIDQFKEIQLDFTHSAAEGYFPFTAGTAIDINADGKMELFLAGSKGQDNAIFSYENKQLKNITDKTGLAAKDKTTFGATSFDIDNDGDTDLIVAHGDGVWIYYNDKGVFSAKQVPMNAPENSFPANVAIADINRDGYADLYVSNFITLTNFVPSTFNDPDHAKTNVMLLNQGDGSFKDVTEQTGTAGVQNTFASVFVDLDNNGYQDLVVANNTGPVQIFKNLGNLNFEHAEVNSGLGYWMGIGVGDIDKDGDQDLYFSNIGSSIPKELVRGDLKDNQALALEWLVLQNNGDWTFTNATKKYALDGYGFAWGGVFEDINLDGDLDLLVGQNYVNWPGHNINKLPNKAFLQLTQNDKQGFYHIDQLGLNNKNYGQTPLIIDLNNDNKPDVVWLNMNGPARAFLNTSKNDSLKIIVPDNISYLGANVTVYTKNAHSYTKQVTSNVGMTSDQTPNLFFGLKKGDSVESVKLVKLDGTQPTIEDASTTKMIMLK